MNEATEFVQAAITLMEEGAIAMMKHRDEVYPQEAIGILCSDGEVYPLINQARSHLRFEVSQVLVQEAIDVLTLRGFSPVAIYHSHPDSASGPSTRDIAMMKNMPGALSIIVGVDGIAGWLWDDGLHSVGRIPIPERTRLGEHT